MIKKYFSTMVAVLVSIFVVGEAYGLTINMNALPSSQGWIYSGGLSEGSVFQIDGSILELNTVGTSSNISEYRYYDVIEDGDFTLSVRARIIEEEILAWAPAQTFYFEVLYDNMAYPFALGTHYVRTWDAKTGSVTLTAFNNTDFHDYVLRGSPESPNYSLTIDDTFVIYGSAELRSYSFDNALRFGDGSSTGNAWAEIASYSFTQAPVPEPATLLLLGFSMAGLAVIRGRRKR